MPEIHFTKSTLLALPIPDDGKRAWYHDDETPGLALRLFGTGKRIFYHYRWAHGKPQQQRLGEFPAMTIDQARRQCDELNGAIARGEDPAAARAVRREEKTLVELLEWWEQTHGKAKKTGAGDRRMLELTFGPLFGKKLSTISRQEVRALHANRTSAKPWQGNGGRAANAAAALLRSMWNRAREDEITDLPNPAEGIRKHPERSRDRRLSVEEVDRFLAAVDEAPVLIRDYIRLSLMTGQRKGNVLAMCWSQVNLDAGTWRIPITKNGEPQVVPLEAQEIGILRERWAAALAKVDGDEELIDPWVFPSHGKTGHLVSPQNASWRAILKRSGITDFRLHDLRRTMASFMVDSGASLTTVGKALGHRSHTATLVYARLSLDPVREAKRAALAAMHG